MFDERTIKKNTPHLHLTISFVSLHNGKNQLFTLFYFEIVNLIR